MTLLYIGVGLLAGVLSGLFGIGGGVLIVAALVLIARLPILEATGTSLAALLPPVGLLGAIEYYRRGHIHMGPAMLVAVGLVLGTWVGARFAQDLDPVVLQRLFAVFLVVMAVRLWFSAQPPLPQ